MKIRKITTSLLTLAVLALPVVSLANTYQFINMSGQLQSVEAANATIALDTAYRLGIHSGVMLVDGNTTYQPTTTTYGSGNFYQFVDVNGNLQIVQAANATIALDIASRIGAHSGVMLVSSK